MKDLKFLIPKYLDQDWETKAKSAEGLEHLLLANIARAKYLVKEIEDFTVTPERLGWMLVWVNTFSLSKNVYLAWKVNSKYLVRILGRIEDEFSLVTHTIFEPIVYQLKRYQEEGNITPLKSEQEKTLNKCVDRLIAYLAFCMVKDIEVLNNFIKPKHLNGIFDPNPGREIKQNSDSLQFREKFYGKFDLETDEKKLEKEKDEFINNVNQQLKFIGKISNDPKVKKWMSIIKKLKAKKDKPINFFEVFNSTITSVWKKFMQYNLGYGYLGYQIGSLLMHSSTFEQQFAYFENNISPRTHPIGDRLDSKAKSIFDGCTDTFLKLRVLQNRLWKEIDDLRF